MRNKKFLWFLAIPFFIVSCWNPDDLKNIEIEPVKQSWVLPVLNSTITFKEMVERSDANTTVEEGPGGVYYMAFRDTLDFASATDEFELEGASFNFSLNYPLVPGFSEVIDNQDFSQTYEIVSGAEIKQIEFLTGNMNLTMVNNYHHRVLGTLFIRSLERNQVVHSRVFDLAVFSSSINDNISLNDYILNLFDEDELTYNTFTIGISFTIQENGSAPTYDGSLDIGISFSNPDYEMIVGRINKVVNTPDQAYIIAAFNSTVFAEQHFAEPYFDFTVENSYGMPVGFSFTSLQACNNSGEILDIVNTVVPGEGDIDVSGVNQVDFLQDPSEDVVTTQLRLSHENSNLADIFDIAPNKLTFGNQFQLGDNSHDRFIRRDSRISFISDLVLPLYGWAVTHELHDTIMDMRDVWPDISNLDRDLESDTLLMLDDYDITLKFKVTNEMPLNIRFQLFTLLETEGGVVRDYQFFSNDQDPAGAVFLASSADVNPSTGESVGANSSYVSLRLTKEEFEQITDSDHLLIMYWLSTGGSDYDAVKVLSTNKMKLEMSIIVSGSLKFYL